MATKRQEVEAMLLQCHIRCNNEASVAWDQYKAENSQEAYDRFKVYHQMAVAIMECRHKIEEIK